MSLSTATMTLHATNESTTLRRQLDEEYADVTPPQPNRLFHTKDAPPSTATDSSISDVPAPLGSLFDKDKLTAKATDFATVRVSGCPETIVHDPRESGDRLYTAYYQIGGASPGVLRPRGFATSPKDYLAKMNKLQMRGCSYTPTHFERKRVHPPKAVPVHATTLSQRQATETCPLWRNVMLTMLGTAAGYLAIQSYLAMQERK